MKVQNHGKFPNPGMMSTTQDSYLKAMQMMMGNFLGDGPRLKPPATMDELVRPSHIARTSTHVRV